MKPLSENHFTPEDWGVIVDVTLRCGRIVDGSMFGYWVMERSRQSDRRDAELILTQMINHCIVAYELPAEPPLVGRHVVLHIMRGAVWPPQEVRGLEYP